MNLNLDTNINNLNYILHMQNKSRSGEENGKSKAHLEKEQTTTKRKWEYKKIISRYYPPIPAQFNFKLVLLRKYIVA